MEDLSDYQLWRQALIEGIDYPQAAQQLGHYLAQVLFYSSDFYLLAHEKKTAMVAFSNPEMCAISEALFFDEPYHDHPRNDYPSSLRPLVSQLWHDQPLKIAIAQLKHHFFCHSEALLHGDIHSGSIFVTPHQLKVIDGEFGYFGPIGFDLGVALGNLLLNYCAIDGLFSATKRPLIRQQRQQDIQQCWQNFASHFSQLAQQHTRDLALAQTGYVQQFLQKVWHDSVGFAGSELIRRTIGFAHVADLEQIAEQAAKQQAMANSLQLGRSMIVNAAQIQQITDLIDALP